MIDTLLGVLMIKINLKIFNYQLFKVLILNFCLFSVFSVFAGEWVVDGSTNCKIWSKNSLSSDRSIKWSGECLDGMATGKGVLQFYKNEIQVAKFEGEYLHGKRNGRGVYWTIAGNGSDLEYVDDKPHGFGKIRFVKGQKIIDSFGKNGVPEGYWSGNEYVAEGMFENGVFVRSCPTKADCLSQQSATPLGITSGNTVAPLNPSGDQKEAQVTSDLNKVGVKMTARLALPNPRGDGNMELVGNECLFIYPTRSDEYVEKMRRYSEKNRTTFTWSGDCTNGWLHGNGKFGIGSFNPNDMRIFTSKQTDEGYRHTQFDNGIQRGALKMRVNKANSISATVSGNATNFRFDGLFDVEVTTCAETGIFGFCVSERKEKFRAVLLDDSANWWNHIFDRSKTALCSETVESIEKCRWGSDNENMARDDLSRLVRAGNCGQIESKAENYRKRGGINFDITGLKEECDRVVQRNQQEARFSALLASKNPREMFIAAAGYEDKGERSRAKSLYRAIMTLYSKSNEALMAADRLTKLGDVEGIEQATSRASGDASQRAYQQCKIEMDSCYSRTNGKGNCYRDCSSIR